MGSPDDSRVVTRGLSLLCPVRVSSSRHQPDTRYASHSTRHWGDGTDTTASSQGVGRLEERPTLRQMGRPHTWRLCWILKDGWNLVRQGRRGITKEGQGKLERVWLYMLSRVAGSLGRFLGLRGGCRSWEAGVEAFPYLRFPFTSHPATGSDELPACSCRCLHAPAFQPWPDTSSATPSSSTRAPISRLSLPWSFPLAGRGPLQAKLLSEALPCPSAQMSGQLGHLKAFPAAACSCCLIIQSVTPQGVSCTLTLSLCFPENPTSNGVSDFTSVLSTRQDPFALL